MIQDQQVSTTSDDEVDLFAVVAVLWKYKHLIAATSFVGALVAVVLALTATPLYRAEAVIAEVQEGGMNSASSLNSQFGGLASLVGVNLRSGGVRQEARPLLNSRRLVEEFIVRHDLMGTLFPEPKEPPTLWLGVKKFREGILSIREDARTGVTVVEVTWTDPSAAASWANQLVVLVNELVRTRALDEAKRNIDYLNEQIAQTNVVELQRVIYNLIENETQNLMLANARTDYAYTIIDPAVAPEIRLSPRRTVMVLVGGLAGGFVGTMLAALLNALRNRRNAGGVTA